MVGIVVVSHSPRLAEGVVELAREMGGPDVPLEAAGGLEDPPGTLGTDAELVRKAIERARTDGGVLVLMDLGSALMSAEMAAEMVEGVRVLLCEAPLVEGAVAAAASARGGASLDEVATEARGALRMKASQLGVEEPAAEVASDVGVAGTEVESRLRIENRLGLHARPAARFVATAARFDAEIGVTNATTGVGPAGARSLSGVVSIGARQGHEIWLQADGPEAAEALEALGELVRSGLGDKPEAAAPTPAPETAPTDPSPRAGSAPAPGGSLTGIAAAAGIAIGPARRGDEPAIEIPGRPAEDPEDEWRQLTAAREAARDDIRAARAGMAERAGEDAAAIFDAHLLLLDDDALVGVARDKIFVHRLNAAMAWDQAATMVAGEWRLIQDVYLRERAADVLDVGHRVLAHLTGQGTPALGLDEPGILVVAELVPAQAAALDPGLVRGIATARGGPTSHAAILARALAIPAVVGLGDAILTVPDGTPLLLDGRAGTVRVDPSPNLVEDFQERQEADEERRRDARARAREPAITRDGRRIEVMANLGAPGEALTAVELGADGVGLLRTEFLFLDRATLPDEDEQAAVYAEIAGALQGRPLIVRTLDVGADKPLPALPQEPEDNPFLGRRGIRLALAEPEVLRVQLRAILRAAAEHPVKVMFPMVATLAEYRAARALLGESAIEVGIMVEVPAAALGAARFAPEVDFFSIGTNDLAQYTMAAERGNERVADLADGPVPAVLQLIHAVCRAAEPAGRWVGVCGELAGDPAVAALFVGLGVTELSMAPSLVPEVKAALRGLDLDRAREAAEQALEAEDAAAARELAAALLSRE